MSLFSPAFRAIYVGLVSVALAACVGYSNAQNAAEPAAKTAPVVPTAAVTPGVRYALPDFAPLVERYGPAVVNVQVLERAQNVAEPGEQHGGQNGEDPFSDFFKRFGIPAPGMGPHGGNAQPTHGEGSGFIVTPDGYILTNAHVVADADTVTVRLTDRREFSAKVVGMGSRTDIAVIKINTNSTLPIVRIGNPASLRAGEWVLAIGSPFGFENSATAGIVSAIARSLPGEDGNGYVPFIQTDVPVNPGNSGGPLFNMSGEVVGINSQIYTRSGGFMGVSFAIPIDVAMDVSNQLKSGGKVSRGWLGVVIQEVNKDLAESFGLEKPAGALVAQIQDDGPAAKGGLQVGDVILSMNGQPIVMSADLPHLVGALKAGAKANLEVIREGKRKNVELTVGAIPEEGKELGAQAKSGVEGSSNRLGVSVAELTDEQKKANYLKGGVVIKDIQDGPASLIGLQPGDVITHLNNQAIGSTKEFTEIAKALPKNRSVSMRVLRQGRASFITFKLAE